jgi:DNA-binding transcriptional MerR regulator
LATPADEPPAGYGIGAVAERTGISVAVLRSWESRFGFPDPKRLEGGHRRYDETDVEALQEVVRARRAGMSLAAAIERARSGGARDDRTIFAALRRARPDLQPLRAPVPTMLAMSRAIEDEVLARAEPAALFASFQRAHYFEPVRERWRTLAQVASAAYVFADFDAVGGGDGEPVEVPIGRGDALAREWSVVADGVLFGAVLAGWELPDDGGGRAFECVWSVEPDVVRDASALAGELARSAGAEVEVPTHLRGPAPPSDPAVRELSRLAHRMVAYVGEA